MTRERFPALSNQSDVSRPVVAPQEVGADFTEARAADLAHYEVNLAAEDIERVPEVVPGFPDRIVPVGPKAAAILKKRTLTNLYNAWLDNAYRELDAAVAAAYGWSADIGEEDALARLLDLNRERAAAGR